MKKTGLFLLVVLCCWTLSGCTANTTPGANANASNANSNANANAAKPVAAAPTADALMAMDKAANEAWSKADTKWFQDNTSTKFVMYDGGQRMDKDGAIKMIGMSKCDIKSMNFTEPAIAKINDDLYVLTYKGTFDGSCTMNGKTDKLPTELRGVTAWTREGDKWMALFHGENPIIDPTKAPPAPPKKESKPEQKDAKKDAPAANSAPAPAAPAKSANSDALAAQHAKGWEAFKNKDSKWFESNITENVVFVDPVGGVHNGRANVIKGWIDMKCEGITKTSFTDAASSAISPTVELLTGKGHADGKCEGQPNGDLYQTSFYVKEGNDWKLAFMFEAMPMPGM